MSRPARYVPSGMIYHVLNRGVGRRTLFDKDGDFLAFESIIEETLRTRPMRHCTFCLMSTYWVIVPEHDGGLRAFQQQLNNTHVKRWKVHRREIGFGDLYHERYRCLPVESDDDFHEVAGYVERNPYRAGLESCAEQ